MLDDDSPKLEGDMKYSYCRSNERLSTLLPEIEHLINSNSNTLDKWFKNYYPNKTTTKTSIDTQ